MSGLMMEVKLIKDTIIEKTAKRCSVFYISMMATGRRLKFQPESQHAFTFFTYK